MICECKETLIRISNISLVLSGFQILKGVNAEIKNRVGHGQIDAVLGPNGAGKTSFLRVMAGLLKPTTGSVTVFNECCQKEIVVEQGMVGLVSQKYPLFDDRRVISNLTVAAHMKEKLSGSEARDKAMEMLSRFGLTGHANLFPAQLSGGQRQRVAIIQQILCSDHYLLLDEPFSGLDPIAKEDVCNLIQEVADMNELNTIIIVTHDIKQAICVADTLWLMGRDHDVKGEIIPGSYIKKIYDLAELNLAWHKESHLTPEFSEFERLVMKEFKNL